MDSEKPVKLASSAGSQVTVVTHEVLPSDEILLVSVKRNADREPMAKKRKDLSRGPVQALLNLCKY